MPYEENHIQKLEEEKILEEKKEIRREDKKKCREENISMIVCLSLAVLILGLSFGFSN